MTHGEFTLKVSQMLTEYEKEIREYEKVRTIDEIIITLAKSEDTILSDRQYYELLKMKGDIE